HSTRPERWQNLPEATNAIPGIWANIMTFWAGPHGCLGTYFSGNAQKAVIFMIVRSFVLELAVPKEDISKSGAMSLTRPFVISEKAKGTQLPLIVKPYSP
ncbi:hypothetical protein GGX14DRAFT_358881, partial [Mycena pura]